MIVAHSLGGLVTAQAIVEGEVSSAEHSVSRVAQKVRGIVFMGTPFGGSKHARWGDLARGVWSIVKDTDKQTVKTLKPDSEDLRHLRHDFPTVIQKPADADKKVGIVFFYEKKKVAWTSVCLIEKCLIYVLLTPRQFIVNEEDASYEGLGEISGLLRNHMTICKFDDENEEEFKLVKDKMLKLKDGKVNQSTKPVGVFLTPMSVGYTNSRR